MEETRYWIRCKIRRTKPADEKLRNNAVEICCYPEVTDLKKAPNTGFPFFRTKNTAYNETLSSLPSPSNRKEIPMSNFLLIAIFLLLMWHFSNKHMGH